MQNHDAIVIGAGITGAAIAYELQKTGWQVLLLEKSAQALNATYYSYGGIPYWSGQTPLQQKLCLEGRSLLANLAEELGGITEYRELQLLLTIKQEDELEKIKNNFKSCLNVPDYLDAQQVKKIEPLFNEQVIQGALVVHQGHIDAQKTTDSYLQAFLRLGGKILIETVTDLIVREQQILGVKTEKNSYFSSQTILSAGALSRQLLEPFNLYLPLYFSHAWVIKTPPLNFNLQTLIMPAAFQRLAMEKRATQVHWQNDSEQIEAEVIEPGAIQFQDGHFCLGQVSQLIPNPIYQSDRRLVESKLRSAIAEILPELGNQVGQLCHCLIAFSDSQKPLIGPILHLTGLQLFTGFSSTILYGPILARHFAQWLAIGNQQIEELIFSND